MPIKTIDARSIYSIHSINKKDTPCKYNEVTECPICHTTLVPQILDAYIHVPDNSIFTSLLYVICFCHKCHKIFICTYSRNNLYEYDDYLDFSHLQDISPQIPKPLSFSPEICKLSPNFVETYNQSNEAECNSMTQICGLGYRKALEFLVKDYLCHKFPNQSENIKNEFLSSSIKRIDDVRIKTLAERATWIGNDETHYTKIHENLNLDDMKRFIKAMLNYIESELAFEEADAIPRK